MQAARTGNRGLTVHTLLRPSEFLAPQQPSLSFVRHRSPPIHRARSRVFAGMLLPDSPFRSAQRRSGTVVHTPPQSHPEYVSLALQTIRESASRVGTGPVSR